MSEWKWQLCITVPEVCSYISCLYCAFRGLKHQLGSRRGRLYEFFYSVCWFGLSYLVDSRKYMFFFLCILCILCSLCFFVYFVFFVYSVVAALVLLASLERRCFLCFLRIPCFYFVFSGQLQASSPGNLLSLERIVVGEKSRWASDHNEYCQHCWRIFMQPVPDILFVSPPITTCKCFNL